MSAIKKFFEKKKTEAKFKLAGKGQKLGDTQAAAQAQAAKASAGPSKPPQSGTCAKNLTFEQRQAAEAALARVNKAITSEDFDKKRSRAAIVAQAKKELDREKESQAEAEKLKDTYGNKKPIELEGPGLLACKGVYYQCPMVGPEVLPRDEMRKRIKQFLYDQLNEEQGLTSTLIIHTLNKDQEKVKVCVTTLSTYLENLAKFPSEEKFRKIRKSNKAYQERVASMEGHDLFLAAAGFNSETIDGEEFWVFPSTKLEEPETIETLQALRDALQSAEPIQATLDRGLRVLLPNQARQQMALPPDFFTLTAEEIKREQQARSEVVERESMLRTKAMREKEELKERRKYRFSLIRVRFPDGLVLQGTFAVYEKFQDILDFVSDNLCLPLPFVLYAAGTGSRFGDGEAESTLMDLALVPSTLLTFSWHPDMVDEIQRSMGLNDTYLREDIAALATTDPI